MASNIPTTGSVSGSFTIVKTEVEALQNLVNTKQDTLGFVPEDSANKGIAGGYAELGEDGKVPTAQLPSYVDDVIEFANLAAFPATGTQNVIYIDAETNQTYRWGGSSYVLITSGAVMSVAGKTGIVLLDKTDIGLNQVDNTSDLAKPISTATQTALDSKQDILEFVPEDSANKGIAGGYAELGDDGKVPTAQLPAHTDNVVEYTNSEEFPATGTTGVIYIAADTSTPYRWDGVAYAPVGGTGDVASVAGKTGIVLLDKTDVGLDQVDNTSDLDKPISTATQTALDAKQGALGFVPEDSSKKGVADGYASLGADGKVPTAQLPAHTDNVVEYTNSEEFPATGTTGVIYIAANTSTPYRWNGATYSPIGGTGDVVSVAGKTGVVTLDKTDVGLNQVDNTSDAAKPISIATQTALDTKQSILGFTPENSANKGIVNGYASLGADGKVPTAQLPSYIDSVVEYANLAAFPATGTQNVIYIDAETNQTYRWGGSSYVLITSGAVMSVAGKTGIVLLDKTDVGLNQVDNTSDLAKPISTATQTALNAKQPLDGDLTAIANLTGTAGILKKTAADTWTLDTSTYLTVATSINGLVKSAGTTLSAAVADSDYVTPTGTTTLTNKTVEGLILNKGYTEQVFAVSGTAPALSPTNGGIQTWTLSGASTPTAGTWAAGQSILLMIDDGSASTINWASLAVTWSSGTAPILKTTGYNTIILWKVGTTIYGAATA